MELGRKRKGGKKHSSRDTHSDCGETYFWRDKHLECNTHLEGYTFEGIKILNDNHLEGFTFRGMYIWRNLHLEGCTFGGIHIWRDVHLERYKFGTIIIWRDLQLEGFTCGGINIWRDKYLEGLIFKGIINSWGEAHCLSCPILEQYWLIIVYFYPCIAFIPSSAIIKGSVREK